MSDFIHIELVPIFPEEALSGSTPKKTWAQFQDIKTKEPLSLISFCALIRNAIILDQSFSNLKTLKTHPCKHLYRVNQINTPFTSGKASDLNTRQIQLIYNHCILKYHVILSEILKENKTVEQIKSRFPSAKSLEDALKKPEPKWIPQEPVENRPKKESTRIHRDKEIFPGHFGG